MTMTPQEHISRAAELSELSTMRKLLELQTFCIIELVRANPLNKGAQEASNQMKDSLQRIMTESNVELKAVNAAIQDLERRMKAHSPAPGTPQTKQ